MLRLAKKAAPDLFVRAGATCVRGYCNEPNGPECPRYITVANPVEARRKAKIDEGGPRRSNKEIVADQQTAATAG